MVICQQIILFVNTSPRNKHGVCGADWLIIVSTQTFTVIGKSAWSDTRDIIKANSSL